MNERGHAKTPVASHPGNTNAAKNGVYSPRMLAPRVAELEAAIESRPAEQVLRDVARHEVAGLLALNEALDTALAEGGVVGRGGTVKDLVRLRLRTSAAIRSALNDYQGAVALLDELTRLAAPPKEEGPAAALEGDLLAEWADAAGVSSIAELDPLTFDPECFLDVIAETEDPSVRDVDRNRADRFLLECREARAERCSCFGFRATGDAERFQQWVKEFRSSIMPCSAEDRYLAAVVRAFARGEQLEPRQRFGLRMDTLAWFVDYELRRSRGEKVHEGGAKEAQEDKRIKSLSEDAPLSRFWRTLLSPNTKSGKGRLDAFDKLTRAGALRNCVCPRIEHPWEEVVEDHFHAFLIRGFARTTLTGAQVRATYPESFAALQEMLDRRLLAERGVDADAAEVAVPNDARPLKQ